ncbi:hypothetical protein [Pedobacter jamesrossensis]
MKRLCKTINNKNGVLERYGDIIFMKGEKEVAVIQWQKQKRPEMAQNY